MTDPLKALFGKPDYSHIVRDTTATISITAAEMAAVLEAYDRGILGLVESGLGLVESGLMLVKQWFKVVQGWLKLVEKG
ncbi:hypothetical protein [Escherichia coli]